MTNRFDDSHDFQKQGFWKKKSLGQNFLVNPHIINKIISAAEITENDTIIEVGPGLGILTQKLAEKSKKVIAIEKDKRLIPILKDTLKKYNNIEIMEGDILKLDSTVLLQRFTTDYKIVANIPYYITSHFLRKIFEPRSKASGDPPRSLASGEPRMKLVVLTVQKEVAQRIMAKPPHMNLLALSVQYYSQPEIIGYISKNNFRPVPKVDSAIIRLRPYNSGQATALLRYKLFQLIKLGFSEKRKQLASVLSKKMKLHKEKILDALQKAGIVPTARAENLSLEQWQRLAES
ncbi:MAG: 16S rRNA (adenine(1518)-N(6)/adenine(1519)-N(6))-dimethyltransferase RsmA, partial [Candidatus Taylorbacteria bacterium]|nr:16S rRNA (adenine(1518)-N(6)/adenine(1519)-N(6))-dimethyltransferase RsmA [Candidatus Taylorbacteria bacterium]